MFQLMAISDERRDPRGAIEQMLAGCTDAGVALQLRRKQSSPRALLELARWARPLCRRAGVTLLINDRADVALLCEADGVHLPERGLAVAQARKLLGPQAIIGRSCHDREGLRAAEAQGASYATLSPVFSSPGKGPVLGTQGFTQRIQGLHLPVLALGGIAPETVEGARTAGAAGVAAIRALWDSPDPGLALRALLRPCAP